MVDASTRFGYFESWETSDDNFVVDLNDMKIVLDDLNWLRSGYQEDDSIAVFAQRGRRGYFNMQSGKSILLPEKIQYAWIFRDERSLASSGDSIFIYDMTGREVKGFKLHKDYRPGKHFFCHGYLPMMDRNGKYGLVDHEGNWRLEAAYDHARNEEDKYWILTIDSISPDAEHPQGVPPHAVLFNDSLQVILEGDWSDLTIDENSVIVYASDYTMQRYDLDGKLLNAFLCRDIEHMTYETGRLVWETDEMGDRVQVAEKATASLLIYETHGSMKGLMTEDGHVLTPPAYVSIEAVAKGLYHGSFNYCSDGVLINEKGQIVGDWKSR